MKKFLRPLFSISIVLFLLLPSVAGCIKTSNNSKSKKGVNKTRKKGYLAFIGSYSSSHSTNLVKGLQSDPAIASSRGTILTILAAEIKAAEDVANLVKSERVESIFTTGDNNYSYGCQSDIDRNIGRLYQEYIGSYTGSYGKGASTNEFFPTLGNHDVLLYETYLIKNSLTIALDSDAQDDYRFSRVDWINQLTLAGIPKTLGTNLVDHLLSQQNFEQVSVNLSSGNAGTSYLPRRNITVDDFTATQLTNLKTNYNGVFSVSSTSDTAINAILKRVFKLYCALDKEFDQITSYDTIPYFNYFKLPGNERYYKVSKKYQNTKVDIFILNITTTFNSSTAHEPDGNTVGSVQHQWLVAQTASSDADFKIVLVHDEPHGSFENSASVRRWNLEKYADVVMSGDIQSYERSFVETDHGSAFFLSVGVGGLGLESEDPSDTPSSGSSQKIVKVNGALFMQINHDKLTFTFKNQDGETKDTFSIGKNL